jgi:hypothetical protein
MFSVRPDEQRCHDRVVEVAIAELCAPRPNDTGMEWDEPTHVDHDMPDMPEVTMVLQGRHSALLASYWTAELDALLEPPVAHTPSPRAVSASATFPSAASGAHWFVGDAASLAIDATDAPTFHPLPGALALVAFGAAIAALVTWLL